MEIEVWKAVITSINVLLIPALFFWIAWHLNHIKLFARHSYDWWIQIFITLSYITAFTAEVPAFISRIKAYYELKMVMPNSLYILTTWDRWNHVIFYIIFMVLTYSITTKTIPQFAKQIQ